jgi:hypothetical protein
LVFLTRNNHPEITAHLGSLEIIFSQGAEIVFMDSELTDGTLEAITTFRNIHGGVVFRLPPGLYAAWSA